MLPNSFNFGRPFRPPIRNKLRITCKITILLHLTKKSEEAIFNDLVIALVPTNLTMSCIFGYTINYNTYNILLIQYFYTLQIKYKRHYNVNTYKLKVFCRI